MHEYTYENSIKLKLWSTIITISGTLSFILKWISSFAKSNLNLDISFIVLSTGGISVLLYKVFSKYLWNYKCIKKFLGYPDLNGKWYIEGKGYNVVKKKNFLWNGKLSIEQNFNKILITQTTKKSKSESESKVCSIKKIAGRGYEVHYTYANKTNNSADKDMRSHEGTATIIFELNCLSATSNYYNNPKDRPTYGTTKIWKETN